MTKARTLAGVLTSVLVAMVTAFGGAGPASASPGGEFHNAPGTVHLQNVRSHLCIDPLTESVQPFVVLIQYTCRNAKSQEWEQSGIVAFASDGMTLDR